MASSICVARYFLSEHSIETLNYLNSGEVHQDLHQDKQRFDLWKVTTHILTS